MGGAEAQPQGIIPSIWPIAWWISPGQQHADARHTLLWQKTQYFPKWLMNYDFGMRPATEAERILREHITSVCGHFGSRIFSYDVVNERWMKSPARFADAVHPALWANNAIDICFDAAQKAAPHAKLV
jgi:endo-1,4-beta-xylanase